MKDKLAAFMKCRKEEEEEVSVNSTMPTLRGLLCRIIAVVPNCFLNTYGWERGFYLKIIKKI